METLIDLLRPGDRIVHFPIVFSQDRWSYGRREAVEITLRKFNEVALLGFG
ncbi:Uncharacterised protein [Mycobacterium tuberculosis]|nr:Uncharacterised protein [Mycobacterium tuberculosis]